VSLGKSLVTQFLLVGHPVGHSVSPSIHSAAYQALGRSDAHYSVLDCPTEADVRRVFERLRSGELAGANVTVPHKTLALSLADRVDSSARDVGAANVLACVQGEIVAYNTDAPALAEELLELVPNPSSGALIVGSGGAALAAAVSAKLAGFAPILVTARRFSTGEDPRSWPLFDVLSQRGVEACPWPLDGRGPSPEALLERVEMVIQATSAGMKGTDSGEMLAAFVGTGGDRAYYDLVYNPPLTPFLRAAEERGARARGGLGMLVRQAARAIEIWLGERPALEPLFAAAEQALGLSARAAKS